MHFAANCGNIIRRYCFAAEYALVAQPVEHLTFNQRARDSSSLERTKRTINRLIKRFVVFFVLYGLFELVPMIFSKISEVRGTKMKKIQKNAARFDNLKQDFLDDKKYSGTAEATLNGYRYDITRFLKFLSDEQLTVNEAGFKRYVIHLTDSGMTANSVNHYIRSVKVFLYWCMEQDEIAPFKIKMVKAQETIKDVYTQEELCALIQPPKREDSFVIWRSWAIINFILGTAAREATVCEMQMQDISFDDRTITFRHLKNKHVQLLPMSEALASCLKKYISLWRQDAAETAYLFPSFYDEPLSTNALKHSQARYNRSRGVEKTSVHLLRHSFVKNWCMSGGNVFKLQKVLGHSTLTMTQHYANLYSNDLREGFDSYAALDGLQKKRRTAITKATKRR